MNKHTPGPWEANHAPHAAEKELRLACAVWADDVPICTTAFSVGKYHAADAKTQHANCLLLAAAPQLLAALREALDIAEIEGIHQYPDSGKFLPWYAAGRYVIAQAEGGTSRETQEHAPCEPLS